MSAADISSNRFRG